MSQKEENEVNDSNERQAAKKARTIPRILDGTFYEIIKIENDQVEAQCQKCDVIRKGSIKSTGNFLSHFRAKHLHLMESLKTHIERKESINTTNGVKSTTTIVGPAISKKEVSNN